LCSIHISGACPCAKYIATVSVRHRRLSGSLHEGINRRHSLLSSSITNSDTHVGNQMHAQLGDLLGLFDRWNPKLKL